MDNLQIRDNSRIILGLTGLLGSGCSKLASTLAFEFSSRVKKHIETYDESEINRILESINNLKQVQGEVTCDSNLAEENRKLKEALEKREVVNILKRNKESLLKRDFIYISFSSMIMFYVVRHLQECTDDNLKIAVRNILEHLSFELEEAVKLTSDFVKRYWSFQKDAYKRDRLILLFSNFHVIRDGIIKLYGREKLQDLGDNVRKYGNPFPDDRTKQRIKFTGRWLSSIIDRYIRLRKRYKYFVIECFRNPQELYYFREKYSYFYLLAISSNTEKRLVRSGLIKKEFEKLEQREAEPVHEADICELDVNKCIDIADITIRNDSDLEDMFLKLLRYTAMILEPGSIKPTENETLMHLAYTLSVRSNCLSRQVGAVIVNADGYVIGAGWNDVGEGQLSCGFKIGRDYESNYLRNENVIINQDEKDLYVCIKRKYKESLGNSKLGESDFCPVLHAEENAILQLAKYNSGAIKDGTLFSTTFPEFFSEIDLKRAK